MKRLDEDGPDALLKMDEPVNRFPDFVRHMVRRLQTLCPFLGKNAVVAVRVAAMLALLLVGRRCRRSFFAKSCLRLRRYKAVFAEKATTPSRSASYSAA